MSARDRRHRPARTPEASPQQNHGGRKDDGSRTIGKRTILSKARRTAMIPLFHISVDNKPFSILPAPPSAALTTDFSRVHRFAGSGSRSGIGFFGERDVEAWKNMGASGKGRSVEGRMLLAGAVELLAVRVAMRRRWHVLRNGSGDRAAWPSPHHFVASSPRRQAFLPIGHSDWTLRPDRQSLKSVPFGCDHVARQGCSIGPEQVAVLRSHPG